MSNIFYTETALLFYLLKNNASFLHSHTWISIRFFTALVWKWRGITDELCLLSRNSHKLISQSRPYILWYKQSASLCFFWLWLYYQFIMDLNRYNIQPIWYAYQVQQQTKQRLIQKGNRLTHWGRLMHICVINLTIIDSNNGLSPRLCQAIIRTIAGILFWGPLRTNFSEIF